MNVLSIENLAKTVNDEPLFSSVTLGLESGEKVGIVGKNGAGKSTFLRVINQSLHPDEGQVNKAREADMITLEQTVNFKDGSTLESFLYEGGGRKLALLKDYHDALNEGNEKEYQRLMQLLEKEECWNIDKDYEAMLTEMGLDKKLDTPMCILSGGEQKKAAIARVLAAKPSIMLLDEPTNHLDIKTIEYLESYLQKTQSAVIIVTHDRYILNSVCTTIWELDRGHFFRHPGSYEAYLERRSERIDMEQKEQDRLATILRRELKWLARGPQARTGKDKNRKDRIEAMLDNVHNVQDIKQTSFSSLERRLGKKILDINNISYSYPDKKLFKGFSYAFKKGDRIGIVGDNGSGKSTLLDILTGQLKPTEGSVDVGVNTLFGYYDQLGRNLNTSKTALEFIEDIAPRIMIPGGDVTASRFLEMFGFPPERQRAPVSVFSGGEKRRLYLISKLALNPNFLVLDEPTNDLDIKTMENLEEYISSFSGCTLIVSHDRAFLDCTCDYLFVIRDNKITLFPGHYSDLKNIKEESKEEETQKEKPVQVRSREKKGLSYKEMKEYDSLTSEIDKLESYIAHLEESFMDAGSTEDGNLQERTAKYNKAKQDLEEASDRWFILAEKADG